MTASKSKSATMDTQSFTIAGYSVLLVDDYHPFQEMMVSLLSTLPEIETIDVADDGESALKKASEKVYDLIFLDVMMPGIDGYDTCCRLRDKPAYKKTPIVMISGKDSPFDEVKGIISGCTTYVTKPIKTEPFYKLVNRMINWLDFQKNIGAPPIH